MPTVLTRSSVTAVRISAGEASEVRRSLQAAYSRERIEEVIRAVVEDALSPSRVDVLPWHDEVPFERDLHLVIQEIADTADRQLAERLTDLLESAPPTLADRLAAAPRFSDLG
jgi:hypothetical protein